MAIDSTQAVRKAILTILKADSGVTAIVPKARIYSQRAITSPTWPFVLYGSPSALPRRASCVDGAILTVAVHGFADPRRNASGSILETAEDHASRLGAAIATALDGQKADVATGRIAIDWQGSQLLMDGDEADAFHTVQNFRVRALTA